MLEMSSQNIVLIGQFPEFLSQVENGYYHSVKHTLKSLSFHLEVENIRNP